MPQASASGLEGAPRGRSGPPGASPPEDALRELLALLEPPDGTGRGWILTYRGSVRAVSPGLARSLGATDPAELEGKPVEALWLDTGAGLPDPAAAGSVECGLRAAGGDTLRVRVASRPLGPAEDALRPGDAVLGGSEGIHRGSADRIWAVEDVTRLRALEHELLETARSLHEVRRELEALRERSRREAEEREELLSVVTHELRTPSTVVAGYTRLLLAEEAGPLSRDQRRFLEQIRKSCGRLDGFLGDLASASRPPADAAELRLGDGPLEPVIREVLGLMRPLAEERGLRLELRVHPDATPARFDRERIEQVLVNLVGNALKYAREGGRVSVETAPRSAAGRATVEVAVSDDGPGVPLADRDRIFQPYVRAAAPGARAPEGLGLGLAICRRLVEAHGGAISVTDPPSGTGSRFVFSLPAAPVAGSRKECRG